MLNTSRCARSFVALSPREAHKTVGGRRIYDRLCVRFLSFRTYSVNSPRIRISPRGPSPAPNPVSEVAQAKRNDDLGEGTNFYGTALHLCAWFALTPS